jgi:TonB family protein
LKINVYKYGLKIGKVMQIQLMQKLILSMMLIASIISCNSSIEGSENDIIVDVKDQTQIDSNDYSVIFPKNIHESSNDSSTAIAKKMVSKKRVVILPAPEPCPNPDPDPGPFYFHEPMPEPVPQPDPIYVQEPEILSIAEKMPEFPGGNEKLLEFIKKNIRYPELCKELGIEGNVYVKMVIDTVGRVTQVSIAKGIKEQCGLDQEALRVVKLLPNFIPAENGGKKVSVYYHVPVRFRLD